MARRRRNGRGWWRGREKLLVAAGVLLLMVVLAWLCADVALAPDAAARVLFSETASCSHRERMLVAGVMRNRIGNPAFGNGGTLKAVVLQPGAFSCVGDEGNTNWWKTRRPARMTAGEQRIWEECVGIVKGGGGEIPRAVGGSGRPLVYYHDKSIGKPESWDNGAWRAVREEVTERFVFYSIVAVEKKRR